MYFEQAVTKIDWTNEVFVNFIRRDQVRLADFDTLVKHKSISMTAALRRLYINHHVIC